MNKKINKPIKEDKRFGGYLLSLLPSVDKTTREEKAIGYTCILFFVLLILLTTFSGIEWRGFINMILIACITGFFLSINGIYASKDLKSFVWTTILGILIWAGYEGLECFII